MLIKTPTGATIEPKADDVAEQIVRSGAGFEEVKPTTKGGKATKTEPKED